MAIKMDRQVDATEISYFLNETSEAGVILVVSTAGSGVGLEDPSNVATIAGNSSGQKPIGMLLNEFVNVDLTRTPLNWHKDQAQIGDKATIMTKGWAVTNKLTGSPAHGQTAVLCSSGTILGTTEADWSNKIANPKVGVFRNNVAEDGYARVYVDL